MDPSWRFRPPSAFFPHPPPPRLPFSPPPCPDPYLAPSPRPHHFPMPPPWSFRDEPLERAGMYKRMRLDDVAHGYGGGSFSFEDERRLSLIRDHGRQQVLGDRYPVDERRSGVPVPGAETFGRSSCVNAGTALQSVRGGRDGWSHGGSMLDGGFRQQQFDKIGSEEVKAFARAEFDGNRGYGRFAGDEFQYGLAPRVDDAVPVPSGYGVGEWSRSHHEVHVGRHRYDEGGPVKDRFYQSPGNVNGHGDPRQFLHSGVSCLPERLHFEEDRILESSLQNHTMKNQRFSGYLHDSLPNPAAECSSRQYNNAEKSFGYPNHLVLESFSPPNSDSGVQLHLPPPVYQQSGPPPDKIFSSSNFPPLPPPSVPPPPPPPEPPVRHPCAPIFPIRPLSAPPPPVDPVAELPVPPPQVIKPATNGQSHSQAFPVNAATSCFPIDSSMVLSAHLLPTARNEYHHEDHQFPTKHSAVEKPVIINASHIFRKPHRASRPDHFVIILRGLPGSGKSYMAKLLRDMEVEEGGGVPRIHSMDDYFMTEVEVEDDDGQKSCSSVRSKKQATKTVMEYCYEPEMEEAYRASMLKAFKNTLDDGVFNFVIVDDRNLRVADFAQFWAIGKRSGYEVYLLEATYKDPVGCAARNVHGFTSETIQKMAEKWEEAPSLYMQIDAQSLFCVDGSDGRDIHEVDMEMDMDIEEDATYEEKDSLNINEESDIDRSKPATSGFESPETSRGWDVENDPVKDLGRSKWSKDLDDDDTGKHNPKEHLGALSGLVQTYSKPSKSVCWADQGGRRGFAIGASKISNNCLIIGPGSGYNLSANPLPIEEHTDSSLKNGSASKKHTIFLEHLRAERESFKLVFDRRRQRIGISDVDEE